MSESGQQSDWTLPQNLRVPYRLILTYSDVTFNDIHRDILQLKVPTATHARVEFTNPVSGLIANGGLKLFETSIPRLGPFVFESLGTVTGQWADANGLQLSPTFTAGVSTVPWRGVTLALEGEVQFNFTPATGTLQVDHAHGMINLSVDLDAIGGIFHRR